jgi:hypothetical protein
MVMPVRRVNTMAIGEEEQGSQEDQEDHFLDQCGRALNATRDQAGRALMEV